MTVYCLSSSAYADQPLALEWQGARRAVRQVLSRWRTPLGLGFQVRTNDGQDFELFYDETREEWSIEALTQAAGFAEAKEEAGHPTAARLSAPSKKESS